MANKARIDGKRDAYAGATYADALEQCLYDYLPNKVDYVEAFMAEVAILDEVAKEAEEQAEYELMILLGGLGVSVDPNDFTDDQEAAQFEAHTILGRLLERLEG